jgi:hypothetical protein
VIVTIPGPTTGRERVEITAGEQFRVEVRGAEGLQLTRMEHLYGEGYYSANGYSLRDGMRAGLAVRDKSACDA